MTPLAAVALALVVGLLLVVLLVVVIVRQGARHATMVNRLGVLAGLLSPDKHHQRNPEMRLVQSRHYLRALRIWAGDKHAVA